MYPTAPRRNMGFLPILSSRGPTIRKAIAPKTVVAVAASPAINRDPLRELTRYIVKKLLKEEDEMSARTDTPQRIRTFRCLRRLQYPSGLIADFAIVRPCLVRKETTRTPEYP